MEHIDNQAPDSGIVTCPQCRKDTPEHYMIWDGEKNTVCLWCEEANDLATALYEPNPYHGTYSEE